MTIDQLGLVPRGERTPPFDLLAEQSAVGGMMLARSVVADVMAELTPADFYTPKHEVIFDAILRLYGANEPTDVISVTDELTKTGELGRAGGADYLHTLTGLVPTAANAGYYASIVAEKAVLRRLVEAGTRIVQMGHASEGEIGDLISSAHAELARATDEGPRRDGLSAKTLGAVLDAPDTFDWIVDGLLERRERLMLTGLEGQGKSTVIRQIAVLASAGIHPFTFKPMPPVRVLVVDLENSERQWRRNARPLVLKAGLLGDTNPAEVMALACVERKFDITKHQDVADVHRLIDRHKPDLIAIGPLYRLVPHAINGDDEAAPVLSALDSIRDRGAALLLEAHAGHTLGRDRERDLRPRGSSALLGWPEFGMGLRHQPGAAAGEFQLLRWRGDRDRRNWPTGLRRAVHEGEWPWTPTRFTFAPLEEPT